MPDFAEVKEAEDEAHHHLKMMYEAKSPEEHMNSAVEAICHSILAVGIRVAYEISRSK